MAADMMPDVGQCLANVFVHRHTLIVICEMLAIADLALLSIHCPTATPLSILCTFSWAQGSSPGLGLFIDPPAFTKDKAVHFTPGT